MASSIFGYFLLFTLYVAITTAARLPTKYGLEDNIRGQVDSKREKRSPIPSQSDLSYKGRQALTLLLQDSTFISIEENTIYFTKSGGHLRAQLDFTNIGATHTTLVNQGGTQAVWAQAGDRIVIAENDNKNRPTVQLINGWGTEKEVTYMFTYLSQKIK